MKAKLMIIFCLININLGENLFNPSKNIHETIIAIKATIVKQVFTFLLLSLDVGKYLINPLFNPKTEIEAINPITEIIVVANPISSALNNLAHISKKKNPKPAITAELIIK